jgi:thiamine-phosphate pyrophosphorylase
MLLNPQFPYPLYLVISENDCRQLHWLEVAEQAISGGVDIIQLREKDCDAEIYLEKAKQLKQITDAYNIPLIINDSVEVATAVNAWGIHVGRSDFQPSEIVTLPNAPKYIGWSLEEENQLNSEEMQWVHYLGVSPVFSTPTKTNTITEWGTAGIEKLRQLTNKPLIAIGGINTGNAESIVAAGADSIAVVSAICSSNNPFQAAQTLKKIIHDTK